MKTCKSGHHIFNKRCQACIALKQKWYDKMGKGFVDIEDEKENLIDHGSLLDLAQRKDFQTTEVYLAKITYYQWATQMIQNGQFPSKNDKKIWEFHVKGFTGQEISEKVNLERSWITRKIKKIAKYLKEQGH